MEAHAESANTVDGEHLQKLLSNVIADIKIFIFLLIFDFSSSVWYIGFKMIPRFYCKWGKMRTIEERGSDMGLTLPRRAEI